jgi:hypothetical protein
MLLRNTESDTGLLTVNVADGALDAACTAGHNRFRLAHSFPIWKSIMTIYPNENNTLRVESFAPPNRSLGLQLFRSPYELRRP